MVIQGGKSNQARIFGTVFYLNVLKVVFNL